MSPFLDVAVAAAQAAAEDIMCYYRGDYEIEIKADQTPVTVADRRAEQIIRRILLGVFPDHGFFGEEGIGLDTTSVLAATPGLHPLLLEKLNALPEST